MAQFFQIAVAAISVAVCGLLQGCSSSKTCPENCSYDCDSDGVCSSCFATSCGKGDAFSNNCWGSGCDKPCPNGCSIDAGCNQSTGVCLKCEYGKWGDSCTENCSEACSPAVRDTLCSQDGTCDCILLQPYWGPRCDWSCGDCR
eukprot:TRINITY_DN21492_c0_g1_i1.p1 TRINITY_DN21492_c0_g1~~TRINITY_DN21492_c0_g1_i1.p1  ORF type:complete len:144 (+),score=21.15 TRINITY_DN21492_c0_g1_i1:71-502(+)